MARLTMELMDRTGNRQAFVFHGLMPVSSVDLDLKTLDAMNLRDAVLGVTSGTLTLFSIDAVYETSSAVPQDGSKTMLQWVIQYEDTVTGTPEFIRLPCADLNIDPLNNPTWQDFKTAFEAFHVSSADNPVLVIDVYPTQ